MVNTTKDPTKCKIIDALRVKKYLEFFVYKNRHLPLDKFMLRSKAPIEHLFNCHELCDSKCCWAKSLTEDSHKAATNRMKRVCNQYLLCLFYLIYCYL